MLLLRRPRLRALNDSNCQPRTPPVPRTRLLLLVPMQLQQLWPRQIRQLPTTWLPLLAMDANLPSHTLDTLLDLSLAMGWHIEERSIALLPTEHSCTPKSKLKVTEASVAYRTE